LVARLAEEVIDDTITALGKGTVGAAGVGAVVVGWSIVALLVRIGHTVTAAWENAVLSAASGVDIGIPDSVVAKLQWVEPSVSAELLAVGTATDTTIALLSESIIDDSVTASWELAPWAAGVGGILVEFAVVASLQAVHHAVTAEVGSAVGPARVGDGIVVAKAVVAFLFTVQDTVSALDPAVGAVRGVDGASIALLASVADSITAERELAVGSACIGHEVRVEHSAVALLTSIEFSVSAQPLAGLSVASGSTVALFAVEIIDDSVTASGQSARGSAGVGAGVGVQPSVVALLVGIDHVVSAGGLLAVGSAGVASGVGVQRSLIALLVAFELAVSALELAVLVATIAIEVVSVVALFKERIVDDAVSASGKGAGGSALVWCSGVQGSLVADLVGVDHTVSARGKSAVGSAPVGDGVGIEATVIALLSHDSSVGKQLGVLLDSVSALTVGSEWESVQDLLQEGILGCSLGKQDGEDGRSSDGGVLGGVEQLNLEGELLVSNPVLAWLVEFDVAENVGGSLPVEGSASDDGEKDVVTGVEEDDRGWVVLNVGWVVQVEGSVEWAIAGEADG